jgi:hypothetical protein
MRFLAFSFAVTAGTGGDADVSEVNADMSSVDEGWEPARRDSRRYYELGSWVKGRERNQSRVFVYAEGISPPGPYVRSTPFSFDRAGEFFDFLPNIPL